MTSVLRALFGFVKEAFTENIALKALALAFSLGLFAYLQRHHDEEQRTVPVSVVLKPPPKSAKRELMTPIPASVQVYLRGSSRQLDKLIRGGVGPLVVDLRDGQRDSIVFDESMLSLEPGVEVRNIEPSTIHLKWEDVITREVPLQTSISGEPAEGFVVRGQPEVDPRSIPAQGPESDVEVMQYARLAPFDVTGLTEGTYRRRLAVDTPPSRVEYTGAQSASMTLVIGRRLSEAKFAARPVEVVGVPGATASPRAVDVTVIGPPEVVRALRAEQVVPRVNLSKIPEFAAQEDKKHGSLTATVEVELSNAQSEIQPPTVNVKW
jgi:YbbR domain-containing protein